MTNFKFSRRSEDNLQGVHPDLVKVVRLALTLSKRDFTVIEGLRTPARQQQLLRQGATKTLNSRHLTGHAIDIVPYPLDWHDKTAFGELAKVMFEASRQLKIPIRWGGDWNRNGRSDDETFYDGPHFELLKAVYP
ncbi:M15 family peptidase [Muribacter muris]|uniref:M15 family peptidase n=1 Tax=Muribacter muris TaxID=67855 RepID=A0A4Y9JSB6_9PAST|nr:M15 family metallopeptidase [Muribacter muris]MBF0785779.1 M15 family metallopeptidase [Muribacter muris]MBF0828249.1 M15 family metallopeptidase [Muribacter muris]TFV08601.1 M15 family peptidase [Muribacter muris]